MRWEAVNAFTHKLYDPAAPKIETPRCHGYWPGFFSPKALAWVFDSGAGWRVRVRKRGKWQHYGNIIDFNTAKRIAMNEVGHGS